MSSTILPEAASLSDTRPARIRLVLAEDESLFRDLLCTALAQYPGLEVVGAFPNGE